MMAQWINALKRREAAPRGKPVAFTLIELLVAIAIVVLVTAIAAWAEGSDEPDSLEQALATVRDEMAKSPAPWPQAWQDEYVQTIRQVALAHQDSPGYAARLEIVRNGFAPYWEAVPKNDQRSLFEVRQAEIRWYVESLMAGELPTDNSRQKLREQYKSLVEYATEALLTQFPFLDPNRVQAATADYLRECYSSIEAPLLPIFLRPFADEEVGRIKERWHGLRYARVDLWRQVGGRAVASAKQSQALSGKAHSDYLLVRRSLGQLRGAIWAMTAPAPDYYGAAVAKEIDLQRRRSQDRAQAWNDELRLEKTALRTEYISFLLAALLESVEIPRDAAENRE